MKKFLLVTNILLVAAVVYLVVNPQAKASGVSNQVVATDGPSCYGNVCNTEAYETLSAEDAVEIATYYRGNNDKIKTCLNKLHDMSVPGVPAEMRRSARDMSEIVNKDSRAAWFSLDAMKSYICAIEKAVCSSGCKNTPRLGMRIYFGRYNDSIPGVPDRYNQRHTVFLVPTYEDKKKDKNGIPIQYDFNPQALTSTRCSLTPWVINISDPMFNKRNPFLATNRILNMQQQNSGGSVQNHGQLSPPDDPEGDGMTFQ